MAAKPEMRQTAEYRRGRLTSNKDNVIDADIGGCRALKPRERGSPRSRGGHLRPTTQDAVAAPRGDAQSFFYINKNVLSHRTQPRPRICAPPALRAPATGRHHPRPARAARMRGNQGIIHAYSRLSWAAQALW